MSEPWGKDFGVRFFGGEICEDSYDYYADGTPITFCTECGEVINDGELLCDSCEQDELDEIFDDKIDEPKGVKIC